MHFTRHACWASRVLRRGPVLWRDVRLSQGHGRCEHLSMGYRVVVSELSSCHTWQSAAVRRVIGGLTDGIYVPTRVNRPE